MRLLYQSSNILTLDLQQRLKCAATSLPRPDAQNTLQDMVFQHVLVLLMDDGRHVQLLIELHYCIFFYMNQCESDKEKNAVLKNSEL